jgi:hypothetical protein
MKVEGDCWGRGRGPGIREKGQKKRLMRAEYDPSILYTCMKMS